MTLRALKARLERRKQELRQVNPRSRGPARHKVRVLEVVMLLRRKGRA
jgi:hypothetical protein